MSSQGPGAAWVRVGAAPTSPTFVPITVSTAQPSNRHNLSGPPMWRGVYVHAGTSGATAPAAASLQHSMQTAPQTYSAPATYSNRTTLLTIGSGGTVSSLSMSNPQQQGRQAELSENRVDHLAVVGPQYLLQGNKSRGETSVIYQLRGLPFATTIKDVEFFLRTVEYRRLDVGTLATGESSGNAFVELHDFRAAEGLCRLHNTIITVAADAGVPAANRPRPRYVEVLGADAAKRDQVLCTDARTSRSALPRQRRARSAVAAPAAATETTVNLTYGSPVSTALPHMHPQPMHEPQLLFFMHEGQQPLLSVETVPHYVATFPVTLPSRQSTWVAPVLLERVVDMRSCVGSPSLSWSAAAQPLLPGPHEPLLESTKARGPSMGSRAVPAAPPGVPVTSGSTRASFTSNHLFNATNPQRELQRQQGAVSTPNIYYLVVPGEPLPSSMVTGATNIHTAPLAHTRVTAMSSCYEMDGNVARGRIPLSTSHCIKSYQQPPQS
ncbi:hypothetical protein JKF63_02304 [Porcisia hertigi]|uniref:RRM domain-containing protein n=1 Tax=Porcisia hertigi TaxID=2761500 RepID=A0A836HPB7_9TRYP|nr:hypothetical protein JKF63_02304 [Porcisia hertigi]